jgi:hypothetical protein
MGILKFKQKIVAPQFVGSTPAADIAAGSVTASKMAVYHGTAKTGTGSAQNIAHGLGVVPSIVMINFTGSTASQAVTQGTHTTTNIVVTVTSAATFDVLAFA